MKTKTATKTRMKMNKKAPSAKPEKSLFEDVRSLIESSRSRVAQTVNSELVMLYWGIGCRIKKDILGDERGEYGQQIVQTLSAQLVVEYGRGFSRDNLFRMIQFVERFPEKEIVGALTRQLSWTHFVEIISIDEKNQVTVIPDKTRAAGECMIWNPESLNYCENQTTLDSRSRTRFARLLSGMTKNTKSFQLAK